MVLTVQPGAAHPIENDWEKLAKNAVQCLQTMAQQAQPVPECAMSMNESIDTLPKQMAQLSLQGAQPLYEKLDHVLALVENRMPNQIQDQANVQDSQNSTAGQKWENAQYQSHGGGCG